MISRILIVGYGSIGKRHLHIIRESLPNAEIRILRHRSTQEIPDGADSVCSSLDEVRVFRPKLAVIANPAPFHLQSASALADMGCHLLIEKPLAADSTGVAGFLEQLKRASVVCQVGYNLRYLPSLIEFRRLLQAGDIGHPWSVRCEVGQYLPDWRAGMDYRLGVSASSNLGGGVLLELSHEIDYLRWLFGEVEWVSAWCGHLSELAIDVEDTAHLTLGFFSPNQNGNLVASLNMDFIRRDAVRTCVVIGTDGSLRWNGLAGTVERYGVAAEPGWQPVFSLPSGRDDSYRTQWQHFLACVETFERPGITAADGFAVLKIVEAAKRSAARQGVRQMVAN